MTTTKDPPRSMLGQYDTRLDDILEVLRSNGEKLDRLLGLVEAMDQAYLSMPKAITTMRDGLAALGRDQRARTTEILDLLRSVLHARG